MSNSVIRVEFETRLKTWADAQTPKILIAFENAPFPKPTTGTFLEAFLIPVATLNPVVSGSRERFLGIFQVNCWAQKGKGMRVVEQLAQSVADLFPMLPKTGAVSIESTPSLERPIYDDSGWVIIPVTIRYRYES